MITASRAFDIRNELPIDFSFKTLLLLLALSPVGMVILAHGLSWAVGPETVLLTPGEPAAYTMQLPCMRRCNDLAQ